MVIGTLPPTGKGKFRVSSNPGSVTVKSSLGGSTAATVKHAYKVFFYSGDLVIVAGIRRKEAGSGGGTGLAISG